MEARSKVAAGAASVVPFHCVICFDEFNLTERPPMVLPCGHTFVCLQCTKRLKRCMECREPLFLTGVLVPPPGMGGGGTGGRYSPVPGGGAGYHHHPLHHHHPHHNPHHPPGHPLPGAAGPQGPPPTVPLPIPKNVVLIALMEAAGRQQPVDSSSRQADAEPESHTDDLEVELEDGEYNLDRIISGMAAFSGPCGTYSVATDDGVLVQPHDPRADEKKCCDPSDIDGHDHRSATRSLSLHADLPLDEPFTLQKGQTVQVVAFEDGVAKLARGAGYILTTSSQLVKVSGPLETVCRLEGLLDTVEGRGRDLQATLDENRQIEQHLRRQIEAGLQSEPDHPVISKPPELDFWFDERTGGGNSRKGQPTDSTSEPSTPSAADAANVTFPRTPDHPASPSPQQSGARSLPESCDSTDGNVGGGSGNGGYQSRSPASIDNADLHRANNIPMYRRTVSEDDMDHLAYGCGVALLGPGPSSLFGGVAAPNILAPFESASTSVAPTTTTADPSQSSSDRPAVASRSRSATADHHFSYPSHHPHHHHSDHYGAPTLTSSFDGVDFRTGLSGHRGLSHAAAAAAASGHSPTPRYRQMRLMSEHRGIGRVRGPPARRTSPTGSGAGPAPAPAFGPRFSPYPFGGGAD